MIFNKNNTAEMPSIQRYNCRLYIPPLNKSCICMNFIFDVTIDMAIYNICILICTFKNLILKLNNYHNDMYIYIILV